jgi:hypothetical protein
MSPEILMGVDFDLPTDVFSLGIIVRSRLAGTSGRLPAA